MKLWNIKRVLTIRVKTFVLELLIINILTDFDDSIDAKLLHIWHEMKDNINDYTIEDPANSNNDLSDMFDDKIKTTLSNAANGTLFDIDTYGWESVYGPTDNDANSMQIDNNSKATRIEVIERVASKISNPTRPWAKKD
jgi:hypothetical protein